MRDVYSAVYQALEASIARAVCLASSEAQIQRALRHFRESRSDAEAMRLLEGMSVALQQLALASMIGDETKRSAAVQRLCASAHDWMLRMPLRFYPCDRPDSAVPATIAY